MGIHGTRLPAMASAHNIFRPIPRLLLVVISAILFICMLPAVASAAPGSFLVLHAFSQQARQLGESFLRVTFFDTEPTGRDTVLSSTPNGLSPIDVDDILDIKVMHEDGSIVTYSHDFSNNCSGSTTPLLVNLTPLVNPGKNIIQLTFRDRCGTREGFSDIWAVGGGVFSTGSDNITSSPDFKIVRFLQVPIPTCVEQLAPLVSPVSISDVATRLMQACGFLVGARNPDPPASLSGDSWRKFVASEEFRGFIHLPSYQVTCSRNQVTAITPGSESVGVSPGWTPTITPSPIKQARVFYEKAEWYDAAAGDFHPTSPQFRYSADNSSVLISLREASRIATVSRTGQFALLGHDAPFIWVALHVKVGCDGTVEAVIAHSTIPRVAAYVADSRVLETDQSGALYDFVLSGGNTFHRPGQGNLDPYCTVDSVLQVKIVHTVASNLPCDQAAQNGGLLP